MVVLKTEWVSKLVTLIEDNPLVENFEGIDLIFNTLFGENNVTIIEVSNGFPKLQNIDIDIKAELLVPFSKTYEVSVDNELFEIIVENWGSNSSHQFIVKLLFNEPAQTYVTTLL